MLQAIIPVLGTVIDKIFPDKTLAEKAKLELVKMEREGELQQLLAIKEINQSQSVVNAKEAKHKRLFVSGWRPAIGWICGASIAYTYLFNPLIGWICLIQQLPPPPALQTDDLFSLVTAMLGVAGLRTFEKYRGVSK